ncbi:effector-associated constant component EACC1 [Streptomyces lushanensis]|uniref:effector-associated constant component EACC1 n=1 Tax=Streptomyces lushanensis TaxID=1434255 RepID=UPI003CCB91CA
MKLSIAGKQDTREIMALYRWLSANPELRGAGEIAWRDEEAQGAMGPDLETINVILSNSLSGLNLILGAVLSWRATRSRGPEIRVTSNSSEITLTGADDETISRLALLLAGGTKSEGSTESDAGDGS